MEKFCWLKIWFNRMEKWKPSLGRTQDGGLLTQYRFLFYSIVQVFQEKGQNRYLFIIHFERNKNVWLQEIGLSCGRLAVLVKGRVRKYFVKILFYFRKIMTSWIMRAQYINLIPLNLQVFVYLLKGLLEQDSSESQEHLLLIATRWFLFEDQIPCCRSTKCLMCFKFTNTIFQRYMKYLILDDEKKFTFLPLLYKSICLWDKHLELGDRSHYPEVLAIL